MNFGGWGLENEPTPPNLSRVKACQEGETRGERGVGANSSGGLPDMGGEGVSV